MRIVFDTAALIAALRSRTGAANEVLGLALRGEIVLLMDYKLASEYRDVALRPEHLAASRLSASEVSEIILTLEAIAEPVLVISQPRPLSSDPDDDMVLDIAINAAADAIVTHNVKHFEAPAGRFGIPVLTPSHLLNLLRRGKSHAL